MGGRALHPRRTQHANGDQETEDEAVASGCNRLHAVSAALSEPAKQVFYSWITIHERVPKLKKTHHAIMVE